MTKILKNISELVDNYAKWDEELSKKIYLQDEYIIINVGREYPIALTRCNTPEKALGWVFQLSEKSWMTTEILRRFVAILAQEHGFDLHNLS